MSLTSWLLAKLSNYYLKETKPPRGFLCDFSRISHEVRPADVLLIEGRNRISKIIQNTTNSPWTHAALYIGRIHNLDDPKLREYVQHHYRGPATEKLLIETQVGTGSVIVPLSKYEKEHIRVCRPTGISHEDAQSVIAYAVDTLGQEYDIRHFFDMYRFFVGSWFIPRTWKSVLFSKKHSGKAREDICSTMIARAFESVRFPVLPLIRKKDRKKLEVIRRNPNLYAPCDFDYSPYFDIIKYPMIPVAGFHIYRQLPWHEELVSNDDQGIITKSGKKDTSEDQQ